MRAPSFALLVAAALLVCLYAAIGKQTAGQQRISVIANEAARRVDVTIDGRPFTSYIWPEKVAKPILFPLRTAKGTLVTRGFPLEPRPGERADHPHQVGFWLTYGHVNDFDFWGTSEESKPEDLPKAGTIRQRRIVSAKGGSDKGELEIEADWVGGKQQQIILKEHTRFVFRGGVDYRKIDRITTLQAQGEKVVFRDDKEGMLGMRVARALEAPSATEQVFTDANGRPTVVPKMDNTGATGVYLTSEGKEGDAAWGTRARWCKLSGHIGDEPVTIAIVDHPSNPGFPTYWHARGYGLFAANPLGQKVFSDGREELNLSLAPGQSVTFRYRISIFPTIAGTEATESEYKNFAAAYR